MSIAARSAVVLDTNIVLDLLVFNDAAVAPLKDALAVQRVDWIATAPMRIELARVLAYPQIAPRLVFYDLKPEAVLERFDAMVQLVDAAPKACVVCSDADDQMFIDLAVAHRCTLLSKDRAVLSMKKRLLALDVQARSVF